MHWLGVLLDMNFLFSSMVYYEAEIQPPISEKKNQGHVKNIFKKGGGGRNFICLIKSG